MGSHKLTCRKRIEITFRTVFLKKQLFTVPSSSSPVPLSVGQRDKIKLGTKNTRRTSNIQQVVSKIVKPCRQAHFCQLFGEQPNFHRDREYYSKRPTAICSCLGLYIIFFFLPLLHFAKFSLRTLERACVCVCVCVCVYNVCPNTSVSPHEQY